MCIIKIRTKLQFVFNFLIFFKENYDKIRVEFEKIKQSYSKSLEKISALEIELEIQNVTCTKCKNKIERDQYDHKDNENESNDLITELILLKQKLIKKSQLLEKAKILLTRAAAKEKNFKEQVYNK